VSARIVELDVLRYDPERDAEPYFQRYAVPCEAEWVVLDALTAIKERIDPTLAFRWSCHMAICGSCGITTSSAQISSARSRFCAFSCSDSYFAKSCSTFRWSLFSSAAASTGFCRFAAAVLPSCRV
jgi:hypothetical protein